MKYRVTLDLAFDSQEDAKAIIDLASKKLSLAKAFPNEVTFYQIEECHHDEQPPQPCRIIARKEVS